MAASRVQMRPVLPGMPVMTLRRPPGRTAGLIHGTEAGFGDTSVSTIMRSKTWSRSQLSRGRCWKYQAISPVSGSRARVELV